MEGNEMAVAEKRRGPAAWGRRIRRMVLKLGLAGGCAWAFCSLNLLTVVVQAAGDTPTTGGGDCWRSGTPLWCRDTWAGRSSTILFRAIDDFSGGAPGWSNGINGAVSAWNAAPGPQYYSFSPASNDTWVYLHDDWTGRHDLSSDTVAITWNCRSDGYCTDNAQAFEVDWTEIYGNHDDLDNTSDTVIQNAFAHESGHAMGLFHSENAEDLMAPEQNNATAPSAADIGTYPGCSNGGAGIRCVYGSGD
jgi:hypothetical protein